MHISKNFDADQILASVAAWQVDVVHEHANKIHQQKFDADQILASVAAWQVEDLVVHEHANNVAGRVYFYCVIVWLKVLYKFASYNNC